MLILGIDEVGRGCIAGPLVVGAVALDRSIEGIKDSKLLSRSSRIRLSKQINLTAKFCGLGWVSASEIDDLGLSASLTLAAKRALANLTLTFDQAYLDGSFNYLKGIIQCQTVIGGDNLIEAVSAASIIAKVARDNFMVSLESIYPNYGFSTHVGYCTPKHIKALAKYGPLKIHRHSFEPVKSLIITKNTSLTKLTLASSTEPARQSSQLPG